MPQNDYTPVLSTITMPSGSTYYFKDAWAREQLETLTSYSQFLGVTTSNIEDGVDINPIIINGEEVTADNGDIAIKGSKEFIWNGSSWAEFGDLSAITESLGELAYVDEASGSYTPEGTVSAPAFTGTAGTVNVDGDASGDINASFVGTAGEVGATGTWAATDVVISGGEGTATYTPEGEVSQPTFEGTPGNISITYTPEGTITAQFEGTQGDVSVSGTPNGIIQIAEVVKSLTGNYTPTGTITAPALSVTAPTTSVATVLTEGSAPSVTGGLLSMSVGNSENLIVTDMTSTWWNAGAMPTFSTASVVSSVGVTYASDFTFSGDTVQISGTFTGSDTTFTGKFTPSGNIVSGSFAGTEATLSSSFTPAGSVTKPTFSGTGTRLTGTVASQNIGVSGTFTPSGTVTGTFSGSVTASGDFTPSGSVAAPTFTGTAATITVSASAGE